MLRPKYKIGQVVKFLVGRYNYDNNRNWKEPPVRIGKIGKIKYRLRETGRERDKRVEYIIKSSNESFTVMEYSIKELLILETLRQAKN